jgi:hypothetical protein
VRSTWLSRTHGIVSEDIRVTQTAGLARLWLSSGSVVKNLLMFDAGSGSFTDCVTYQVLRLSGLRCVTGEDKVASFGRLVARKTGFERRPGIRFTVFELSKPPATRRGIFV